MSRFQQVMVAWGLVIGAAGCEGKLVGHGNNGGDDGGGGGDVTDAPSGGIDARSIAPIPPDCLEAANRGLAWLVTKQGADGSWGTNYKIATTGFAVLKLETYAMEIGQSPFDPGFIYAQQVKSGLDYLFLQARLAPLTMQTLGNPDSNGNGLGVTFSTLMYENSISLMAVAAGADPSQVVSTVGSPLEGMTFKAVVQESTDFFAFAQGDATSSGPGNCARGGWRYGAFNNSSQAGDNSVTQFATLALEYARHPLYRYEIPIPEWVTTELRDWVTCIQNHDGGASDGASGYTSNTQILNAYKTGALVQQQSLLGDTPNTPAVGQALAYLARVWPEANGNGWRRGPVSDYLSMYSIMKGMESMAITDLNGIDWYRQFCDQLKAEQLADGSWPPSQYEQERLGGSGVMSTEWALLVLERAAPPPEVIP